MFIYVLAVLFYTFLPYDPNIHNTDIGIITLIGPYKIMGTNQGKPNHIIHFIIFNNNWKVINNSKNRRETCIPKTFHVPVKKLYQTCGMDGSKKIGNQDISGPLPMATLSRIILLSIWHFVCPVCQSQGDRDTGKFC